MTALSDAELRAATEAVRSNRPLSPMTGAALIGEVLRLRRLVADERKAGAALFAETGRLSIALDTIRRSAETTLADGVSPTPENRTTTEKGARP